MWLIVAGVIGALISALVGVSALTLLNPEMQQQFVLGALHWWQGDTLGVILFTPLILIWRRLPDYLFKPKQMVEFIFCFGFTFLIGQIVFLGWFDNTFGFFAQGFLMFIFISWAALRFGSHGVSLLSLMVFLQALASVVLAVGYFRADAQVSGLMNFWLYMTVLTIFGMLLALVLEARNKAEASLIRSHALLKKISQQVPGVIYQFRVDPDGHYSFPFASDAIKEIYEVTPEQAQKDASAVFAILHPDDYDGIVASIQESAQKLTKWQHEYRVVLPRQGTRWRAGQASPEKLEDGSIIWHGFITDITENKRIEEDRNRLAIILEQSLNEIYIFDTETLLFDYVNKSAQRNLGYTQEELSAMTAVSIKPDFDEFRFKNVIDPLLQGRQNKLVFETTHLRADGTTYPVEVHLQLADLLERPVFMAITLDITTRSLAEANALRVSNLYKALSEVNQAIVRMEDQNELFPLVCRCAVEFGGMSMAWVGQLDETSGLVLPVAKYGSGLDFLDGIIVTTNADMPEGRGPMGIAMRENRSIVVNDYYNTTLTAPWQQKAASKGWKSGGAFPISRGGQPFAVLSVFHLEINAFDDKSIALLEEMSTDIAFALDNFDREVQRKVNEESLILAASIYSTTSEAMMVVDVDNHILAINPAFTQITGYSENEVIGKNPNILKSGKHDEAFYQAMWDEILNRGTWQGEVWDKRKNGEIYPKWLIINTVFDQNGSAIRRIALFNDISHKKTSDELIWQQANIDQLTGLPNRRMFNDRLEQEIKRANRSHRSLSLFFLDLDYFKEVNDTMGHAKGDLLLSEAARRLRKSVRESDTVARFGGDEFTILLSELHDADSVGRVIHDILNVLSAPFDLDGEVAYVSVSIGITCYPNDGMEIETLLKNADQAMYAAKAKGRNGFSYFTPAMQVKAQHRMRLANDLRSALTDNQLWVAYQPIVELKSGNIHKAEALVRWQHPKHGLVNPAEFIPVAEHTGLINDIGDFVFQHATQSIKHWQEIYNKDFQISVNVSPVQLNDKSGKYQSWGDQLKKLGLPRRSIVMEITEGLLLEANPSIKEKLLELHTAGIETALDDFGTGYSSLSYLKKFDIDYIKIDRSFVNNLSSKSNDLALCEAMIVMAHKLNMIVIAEGVETTQQLELLTEIGCDFAQGYLLSKPLPKDEFEKLLFNFKY